MGESENFVSLGATDNAAEENLNMTPRHSKNGIKYTAQIEHSASIFLYTL